MTRPKVHRDLDPWLAVQAYPMNYSETVEEHQSLAGQRREGKVFGSLIKEKGVCLPSYFLQYID